MLKGRCLCLFLGFLLTSLAGCASGPTRDVNDPTNSLVFAYIDMEDAPTEVSHAHVRQLQPPTDAPFWSMGVEDDLLFNQYLPNGRYQLSNFGGGAGFFSTPHEYTFPEEGSNRTAVRIDGPGIYFLGAYRYVDVETGFFEQGKFDIEPLTRPGEAELLERLLQMPWVRRTQWERRIRDRLAELAR